MEFLLKILFILGIVIYGIYTAVQKYKNNKKYINKIIDKPEEDETPKSDFWSGEFLTNFSDNKVMKWIDLKFNFILVIGGKGLLQKIIFGCAITSFLICVSLIKVGMAIWLSFVIFFLIYAGLIFLVIRQIEIKNSKKFIEQLPEAVDMIARSVQAGVSINKSFAMIGENFSYPLNSEFNYMSDQLTIGIPLRDVLDSSTKRVLSMEYKFFVAIINMNQETGGELSAVLMNLSNALRERKGIKLKLQAMTSESRAAAKILSLFPFIAMGGMYFTNPTIIEFLFYDPAGNTILMYAFASIVIGILIMNKISKV